MFFQLFFSCTYTLSRRHNTLVSKRLTFTGNFNKDIIFVLQRIKDPRADDFVLLVEGFWSDVIGGDHTQLLVLHSRTVHFPRGLQKNAERGCIFSLFIE
jgi:hypothetical protein